METIFEILVSKAINNNEEAIEALMNATKNVAYFKAFNYVKNEQDALEVVQVSYINAFSKLNTLEDPSKFDRWFYSIVTRESLNFIKTAEARYTVKFTDIEQKNDDLVFDVTDETIEHQPELAMDKQTKSEILKEIIDKLSDEQRIAIMMYFFDEMTTKEIAEELQVSENTIKSRIKLAKERIKQSVIEVEKRDDIKLYNIAPISLFLLLLKDQEVIQLQPINIEQTLNVVKASIKPQISTVSTSTTATATTVASVATGAATAVPLVNMVVSASLLAGLGFGFYKLDPLDIFEDNTPSIEERFNSQTNINKTTEEKKVEQSVIWAVEPTFEFDDIDVLGESNISQYLLCSDSQFLLETTSSYVFEGYRQDVIKVKIKDQYYIYDNDGNELISLSTSDIENPCDSATYFDTKGKLNSSFTEISEGEFVCGCGYPEFKGWSDKNNAYGEYQVSDGVGIEFVKNWLYTGQNSYLNEPGALKDKMYFVSRYVDEDYIKVHTFDQGVSVGDALVKGYSGIINDEKVVDIDVPFIKSYKNGMIMYSNDLGVSQNPRRCFSSYNSFYDLESYWKDKKNGFYTDKGEKITDAIYDYSYNFTEGYAAVKKDGKWAYIDTKGNNVTDFAFDKATPVVQGKAWVTIDGKSGVIDLFSTLSSNIEINNDTVRVKK